MVFTESSRFLLQSVIRTWCPLPQYIRQNPVDQPRHPQSLDRCYPVMGVWYRLHHLSPSASEPRPHSLFSPRHKARLPRADCGPRDPNSRILRQCHAQRVSLSLSYRVPCAPTSSLRGLPHPFDLSIVPWATLFDLHPTHHAWPSFPPCTSVPASSHQCSLSPPPPPPPPLLRSPKIVLALDQEKLLDLASLVPLLLIPDPLFLRPAQPCDGPSPQPHSTSITLCCPP